MYTRQQTFDLAVRLTVEQGGPSIRRSGAEYNHGACAYRGDGGRKCTAGLLIPDEKYVPAMEGKTAGRPPVVGVLQSEGHDPFFVAALQFEHDQALLGVSSDEQWLRAWADGTYHLAARMGLSPAVLTEALAKRGMVAA